MAQTRIIRLTESDWMAYRTMRLSALRDAPDAFGSLLEYQFGYDDSHWQQRLVGVHKAKDFPAFAVSAKEPAGMAWAVIEASEEPAGQIFQMWVKPSHRGSGIGRLIMEHLLDWFKSNSVACVSLEVTCGNSSARVLYESCGFLPFGRPQPLREGSKLLAQEMRMEL